VSVYSISPEAEAVLRRVLASGRLSVRIECGRWLLCAVDPTGEVDVLARHEDFGAFVALCTEYCA
jgi:hypothetical protein